MIKCPSGMNVTEEECEMCSQCRPRPKQDSIKIKNPTKQGVFKGQNDNKTNIWFRRNICN